MRRCLTHALFAVTVATPVTALAQDQNCPPGAWFCEQTEVPQAPAAEPDADEPEAEAPARPATRAAKKPPRQAPTPPPVVIYQPSPTTPPPQVVIVTPGGEPPPGVIIRTVPPPPPPPPKFRWRSEWGINLRLEGVALGGKRGAAEDAGMGGLGVSLRYRPVPSFAFDLGVDGLAGIDYNGNERFEVPLSLNGILYVNPRSRVQFYFMGGMHVSYAKTEVPSTLPREEGGRNLEETEYQYFGGQGGVGLEFRLSRRVALNIDGLAFIRSRTDDGTTPEFRDPDTGRTTDTSGGGLFRGGINFYW